MTLGVNPVWISLVTLDLVGEGRLSKQDSGQCELTEACDEALEGPFYMK